MNEDDLIIGNNKDLPSDEEIDKEPEQYHKLSQDMNGVINNAIECCRMDVPPANEIMFRVIVQGADKELVDMVSNEFSSVLKKLGPKVHKQCNKVVKAVLENDDGNGWKDETGGLITEKPEETIPPRM